MSGFTRGKHRQTYANRRRGSHTLPKLSHTFADPAADSPMNLKKTVAPTLAFTSPIGAQLVYICHKLDKGQAPPDGVLAADKSALVARRSQQHTPHEVPWSHRDRSLAAHGGSTARRSTLKWSMIGTILCAVSISSKHLHVSCRRAS